ncbi:MAG TPA: phytanoyl-CoA dioxygenase family protein [Tepidisphaeraceae bacterium]|jgi:hypothetical protein
MTATAMPSTFSPDVQQALECIGREKAGILPPYLTRAELDELLEAWWRLWNDKSIENANRRFIVDHKLYREPAFAKLATHPVVQEAVRRVIGDFQLAGYSVVATPRNGDHPTQPRDVPFHVDHCVYSDVPVDQARDTFVCVWVNFEELKIENGPFAIAVGTDKWNIGWEFLKDGKRPGLTVKDLGFDRYATFNVGPAGTTAVYSGKTWHSGTVNASEQVRKGLNMNFVPRRPLDSLRRNPFDVCALPEQTYRDLEQLIGIGDYMIARDPRMEGQKPTVMM